MMPLLLMTGGKQAVCRLRGWLAVYRPDRVGDRRERLHVWGIDCQVGRMRGHGRQAGCCGWFEGGRKRFGRAGDATDA